MGCVYNSGIWRRPGLNQKSLSRDFPSRCFFPPKVLTLDGYLGHQHQREDVAQLASQRGIRASTAWLTDFRAVSILGRPMKRSDHVRHGEAFDETNFFADCLGLARLFDR